MNSFSMQLPAPHTRTCIPLERIKLVGILLASLYLCWYYC